MDWGQVGNGGTGVWEPGNGSLDDWEHGNWSEIFIRGGVADCTVPRDEMVNGAGDTL